MKDEKVVWKKDHEEIDDSLIKKVSRNALELNNGSWGN